MTISEAQSTPSSPSPEEEEKDPSYVIDVTKEAEESRALGVLLLSHRCPSCKEGLGNIKKTPPNQEQISKIAKCCSRKEGFIRPQMPIQEIIFRIILSDGNKPTKLSHLLSLLTEEWATPMNPKSIDGEGLRKILASDNYYGFRELVD